MKTFKITYLPSLGSFLDENNIQWEYTSQDEITIYCHDADDLFRIGMQFQKFANLIDILDSE